jgi:glycine C-acetyltransferase
MFSSLCAHLTSQLETIRAEGLWKGERLLASAQGARIAVQDREVLNLCANNYLGLANHPEIVAAAKAALDRWGYGLSSVRFICGTQEIHKELERKLSEFLGTEDTILYSSCFDANGGFFEALLSEQDAIVSDELNHASIIDGVRLCRAQRFRYRNGDLTDLEARLSEARDVRFRVIATDGVFSMDGSLAPLAGICALAERYEALVLVDDSHATGFVGPSGRGTHEQAGVMGRVDVLTGTLGKALGGASGGYASGRREIIEFLRQRSRPYLFSNTVPPAVLAGALKAIELVEREPALRARLWENTRYFRGRIASLGFTVTPGDHPIIPIMIGDAALAHRMAARLLDKGIYVVGFSYPVVPRGKARIRVQMSAALSREDLDCALCAFADVKAELGAQPVG